MTEEAQRVFEAMDGLEAIADPTARAREISKVLLDSPTRSKRLKELRREAVLELREQGLSYRKIAAEVGVSLGTVQDILRGHSGSWTDRPRAKDAAPPTADE